MRALQTLSLQCETSREKVCLEKMRINYIKCSFNTKPPELDLVEKNFTRKRGLRIASFDEYSSRIKVTLMGKHLTHVNLTGGKSIQELERYAVFYCQKLNTSLTQPIRIDSISASERIEELKGSRGFGVRKKLVDAGFVITDNKQFPGCVLRNAGITERGTCVYFRTSGAVNYCGFKGQEELSKMHDAIINAI